jgi:hypothetical protein
VIGEDTSCAILEATEQNPLAQATETGLCGKELRRFGQ